MSKFTVFQLTSLFLIATAVAPAFAQTPYDAVWDVTVETKAGSCEASVSYRLTVQDGKVFGPADIAGAVAHEGLVKVSLGGAYAHGRLVAKSVRADGTQRRPVSRAADGGQPPGNS
jgi:hypothetical protein